MDTRLEALMSAYKIKPKKKQLRPKKAKAENLSQIKQSISMNNIKLQSKLPQIPQALGKQQLKKIHHRSVQPSFRSSSDLSYAGQERILQNTSLDEDMLRLENLTVRNSNARLDLVSIQKRMIEIDLKRKLNPIAEIDEAINDDGQNMDNTFNLLMLRLESKKNIKERMKSLNNLLAY